MGILSKFIELFVDIPDIEEQPLAISEKPKTDVPLNILVGKDYVKIKPDVVFKRLSSNEEEVGLALVWCVGQVGETGNVATTPDHIRNTARFYCNDIISTSSVFRFNPNTEETSWLAYGHWPGHVNQVASNWTDFKTKFGWTSSCHGRGICYSLVNYYRNGDVFDKEPDFHILLKKGNLKLTDGTTLMDKQYCDNAVAVAHWLLRDPIIGLNKPASAIGSSFTTLRDWIESNLVEQYTGGPNVKRFTLNGTFKSDLTDEDKIQLIEDHCFAKINAVGTAFEINIKGINTTPVLHLDNTNLKGGIEVEHVEASKRYNRVTVKWPNPDKNFEYDFAVYPPEGDALYTTWLAEDNGIKQEKTLTRDLCNNYYEALKMAEVEAKESRDTIIVKCTAQVEAAKLLAFDPVTITDPRRGWNQELFLVDDIEEEDGDYKLKLLSYNLSIYDWSVGGEYVVNAPYVYNPAQPAAVANPVYNNNTRILSWDAPSALAIEYIVTVDGDTVGKPAVNQLELLLDIGTYDITIVYLTRFGLSAAVEFSINVTNPVTDPTAPTVYKEDGLVRVIPPALEIPSKMHYQGVYTKNASLDPDVDPLTSFSPAQKGQQIEIFPAEDGVTYYIFYRVVVDGKVGNWLEVAVLADGLTGVTGPAGSRGPGHFYTDGGSWSDSAANAVVVAQGVSKVIGDRVTISNSSFSQTRYWSGSAWITADVVIDGNWIFNSDVIIANLGAGAISADKIDLGSGVGVEENSSEGLPTRLYLSNSGVTRYPLVIDTFNQIPGLYVNGINGSGNAGLMYNNSSVFSNPTLELYNAGGGFALTARGGINVQQNSASEQTHTILRDIQTISGTVGGKQTAITMSLGGFFHSNATDAVTSQITADGIFDQGSRVYSANNPPPGGGSDATTLNGKTNSTAATANTLAERDTSGHLHCVALNSSLSSNNASVDVVMTKNSSDNYLRPTSKSSFRSAVTDGYYRDASWLPTYSEIGALGATATANNASKLAFLSPSSTNVANTVVIRNSSGNTSVETLFYVTLTQASTLKSKHVLDRLTDTLSDVCAIGAKGVLVYAPKASPDLIKYGFALEETDPFFPHASARDESGQLQGMEYSQMISPLYTAIYQLNQQIEALTSRIEELENAA